MNNKPTVDPASHERTIAVVLAAGRGSRFDGATHKLNARIGSDTVASHALRSAVESDIGEVVVVTGATELVQVPSGVTELQNPDWVGGQATSLATAVEYAERVGADAIVVGLADQPFVTSESWRCVARSHADIAYATYDGVRGHPVRFAASVWPHLPMVGDAGARELIRVYRGHVDAIPCTGSAVDIDTVEDLATWQNNSLTNSPLTDP